jgi:hypothetical protein
MQEIKLAIHYGFKLVEGPCVVREVTSATTDTYDAGDVIGISAGVGVIASDGACAGVALKDSVTSGVTPYIVIDPTQVWRVCYNGTTASTMIGVDYLMTFTTAVQILTSTESTPTCTVLGLANDAGEYGDLHVRFNVSNCQMTGLITA